MYKLLIVLFLAGCASYPSDNTSMDTEEVYYAPESTLGAPPMVRAQMRGIVTEREYRMMPSYLQDYYDRED